MKNIAIFASGQGTNAEAIITYFKNHPEIKIVLVVSNNPEAGVIKMAHQHKVISAIVSKPFLGNEESMNKLLHAQNIEGIVLAGFLQMIPVFLTKKFLKRMINIHPALLPKFGGKGMYGIKVHEAVLKAGETETGITIHYVNESYDEGEVILQKKIPIEPTDTPEKLAAKVRAVEHEWYPKTIEEIFSGTKVAS